MRPFDPLGESVAAPAILESLRNHPERGQWEAAGLFRLTSPRWPRWPLRLALATVDSALDPYVAEFMVRPPHGWVENDRYPVSSELSVERVVAEALSARQAVTLLNDILGTMRIAHNWAFNELPEHHLEQAAGVRPTWTRPTLLPGDSIRELKIGENGFVIFGAKLPPEGTLFERAAGWARASVAIGRAHQLLCQALTEIDLCPEPL